MKIEQDIQAVLLESSGNLSSSLNEEEEEYEMALMSLYVAVENYIHIKKVLDVNGISLIEKLVNFYQICTMS